MKQKKTPKIERFYSSSAKGRFRWELADIAFGKVHRINGRDLRDKDGKIIEE